MLIVMVLLLALVIFFGMRSISLSSFRGRTMDSFYHGLSSNVASAISTANRLESTTNSTTSYTLGLVRQYIYSMDQVNQMCANLTGKTYVPQDAFTALYSDLENYQALVPFIAIALIYLGIVMIMVKILSVVEKRMRINERRT